MTQEKKKIIRIGVGIIIILVIVFLVWLWLRPSAAPAGVSSGSVSPSNTPSNPAAITNIVLNRSAYQIALARAAQWESNAALMKMHSLDTTGNSWDFTFISASVKNEGFEIVVNGQMVISAQEIQISGGGTALSADLITPDQAIAAAHVVPGYSTATIVSLNLIYSTTAHQWYWGVQTSNGVTLTIKATP